MKPDFKAVSLILCFAAVAAISAEKIKDRTWCGGPQQVTPAEFKENKDAQDGFKKVISILTTQMENKCGPDYDPKVYLPDLKVYDQLVSGTLYTYEWTKEDLSCHNRHKPPKMYSMNVNCTAEYLVQPWNNFYQLKPPECS